MVFGISLGLDAEERIGIAQMRLQGLWHLVQIFEEGRVNLLVGLSDRIIVLNDVEISIAVIGVDDDLDGIADIVD